MKHLHFDTDWIARATGDVACRPLVMWKSGMFDALPDFIDSTIVGVADKVGRDGLGAAILMRDVSEFLVPAGSDLVDVQQHTSFIQHMALLHAHSWGWVDDLGPYQSIGLTTLSARFYELSPLTSDHEAKYANTNGVPPMIRRGWERLCDDAPRAATVASQLFADPWPLLGELSQSPHTLIHGDMKLGNLGTQHDQSILLDWAVPGAAPPLIELAWYLAVNCQRIPETKEATIARYHDALTLRGIETRTWWDKQLALALLFGFAQLGWSKHGDELDWWARKAVQATTYLA